MPAPLPELLRIRQRLESRPIPDPAGLLARALEHLSLPRLDGRRIFIAVPSRGIDRMALVLAALGRWLRDRGAEPVAVPAMGSHGGGTASGQIDQLRRLGLGEEATGLPLLEPSSYHDVAGGFHLPVETIDAGGLVLVNRVKLHTLFTGPLQSGLCKLLAFGLGGPLGAAASHRHVGPGGLLATAVAALEALAGPSRLLFGIGLVEDATHRLSHLEAVPAAGLLDADQRLLGLAASLHPRLPLRSGDLLVVERMGKDISGTGMDPHVIGRPPGSPADASFASIFVRGLSTGSHGNALGIGYADHALSTLVESMDLEATRLNALTSGSLSKARIPAVHPTDRDAISAALSPGGCMLQISDTLHVGEALAAGYSAAQLTGIDVLESLGPLDFRPDGRLTHLLTEEAHA